MDNPAPAVPTASSNLTSFLRSFVPPYFLTWGPYLGVWYALVSFTGLLCHRILALTAFIILFSIQLIISKGPHWLLDNEVLPVSAINPVVLALVFLSIFGWWLIASMWMGGLYRKHADNAHGWRAYMFGGGWARRWRNNGSDSWWRAMLSDRGRVIAVTLVVFLGLVIIGYIDGGLLGAAKMSSFTLLVVLVLFGPLWVGRWMEGRWVDPLEEKHGRKTGSGDYGGGGGGGGSSGFGGDD